MTVSEEEIQRRKEASIERYKKLKAGRDAVKEKQAEASQWLKDKKVDLLYLEVPYMSPGEPTTITIGCQVSGVDDENVEFQVAYAILSPRDQFSRPAARQLIADRLRGIDKEQSPYQFTTSMSRRAARIYAKLHQAIEFEVRREILTRPDIAPQWLTKGIENELKQFGYWSRWV